MLLLVFFFFLSYLFNRPVDQSKWQSSAQLIHLSTILAFRLEISPSQVLRHTHTQ